VNSEYGLKARIAGQLVLLNMPPIKYSTHDVTAENMMNIYLQHQLWVHEAKVHDERGQHCNTEMFVNRSNFNS